MNATATLPATTLLTAGEFLARHGNERAELIDGIVVWEKSMPAMQHGEVCNNIAFELTLHVRANDLGRVCTNDTFVQTKKSPDRVRGADVSFYSYARQPKGPAPTTITDVVPDLVVEVTSPSNERSEIFAKVGEYLKAGVRAVLVLDAESATASVYRNDEFQQIFDNGDDLVIPDVLPGFSVPVKKLFGLQ